MNRAGTSSGGGEPEQRELRGTGASPGIAIGRAYVVERSRLKIPRRHIDADEVDEEIARFRRALRVSDRQLEWIKEKIEEREESEHYNIIAAHQLILHDEHVVDETERYIRDELLNAEWALRKTVEHIKGVFDAIDDEYFRERRSDVDFVGERILRNLLGYDSSVKPPPDAIVVPHDLSPADSVQLFRSVVAGLATDAGGKTAHTSIIARSNEVPAVVGLEDVTEIAENGDLLIVDGTRGLVILHPTSEMVSTYRDMARKEAARGEALLENRDLPAQSVDDVEVALLANVDHVEEVRYALEHGAVGVGLFRTEYLFMMSDRFPGEEDHYEHAKGVLEALGDKPATFRTFDLGADKVSQLLPDLHAEANPALGLRSMRLCLTSAVRPVFKEQLRGLLRASVHGKVRIMFPMISGLRELQRAREVLEEAKDELWKEGTPFDREIEVGVMIEMPSAAVIADLLAPAVDFFSIGTNDLIQYTLAVDRVNEYVAYAYEPLHPALFRLIEMVVKAANRAGISVGVCGEAAGDPLVAPALVGLGLRELSMSPTAIPEIKSKVRAASVKDLKLLVAELKELATSEEIREAVLEYYAKANLDEGVIP
jgi:phosphoenolpyruvate-protein phosphotransferase (PTS system enzyme I)